MPTKPPRQCPRCGQPTKGRCEPCHRAKKRESDAKRPNAATRGYDHRHRTHFRPGVLVLHPICQVCNKRPSTEADHYPHSRRALVRAGLDPYDPIYGRGLCSPCHKKETAKHQPGGWHKRDVEPPPVFRQDTL